MRDLIYLNSIYESLDEGIGIKTTKLKPFYDAASSYDSQRNPMTNHRELKNPARRSVQYDYGNANYEEISAEEALRLIKQNKANVQKLRIIFDLSDKTSLVEYEVRDNGSIYAIYGSPDRVVINGREYKNIRYASYKTVIENADLIYLTDEYEKYLDADPKEKEARERRNDLVQLPLYADESDKLAPDYDVHNLYANAYNKGSTGRFHKAPARYVMLNPDTGAHEIESRYHPTVAAILKPYIEAQKSVKSAYEALDRYRRALKKLEQDRDVLDDDEYARKKERWQSLYNDYLENYRIEIAKLKKIEAKVDKQIDAKSAAFAEKLRQNIYEYDTALKKGFELSKQIQELKSKLTGDLTSDRLESYDLRSASTSLKDASNVLVAAKETLEEILSDMEANEEVIATAQNRVIAATEQFNRHLTKVDNLRLDELDKTLKKIDDIAKQLREIDNTIARLRPKTAAEKAARAAKNKPAELDPALVDIIDFGDNSDETTD